MSDYLQRVVAKSRGLMNEVRPRATSRFDAAPELSLPGPEVRSADVEAGSVRFEALDSVLPDREITGGSTDESNSRGEDSRTRGGDDPRQPLTESGRASGPTEGDGDQPRPPAQATSKVTRFAGHPQPSAPQPPLRPPEVARAFRTADGVQQGSEQPESHPAATENSELQPDAGASTSRGTVGRPSSLASQVSPLVRPPSHEPPASGDRHAVTPPWRRATQGEERPTVNVTIGRIEVRAVNAPKAAPGPRPAPPEPKLALGEYLRQRDRGER